VVGGGRVVVDRFVDGGRLVVPAGRCAGVVWAATPARPATTIEVASARIHQWLALTGCHGSVAAGLGRSAPRPDQHAEWRAGRAPTSIRTA
jgi:hypothetical protein